MLKKLISSGLIACTIVAGLVSGQAEAHQDPPSCNASGLQQVPSVSPSTEVYDGSALTYSVIYSNFDNNGTTTPNPCNVTGLNASIDLPGAGPVIDVLTNATLNVGDSISCPGGAGCAPGPYTYNIQHSDETAGNVTANFAASGVLHQNTGDVTSAQDNDNLTSDVIHPNTLVDIQAASTTVVMNSTTTLTVRESNTGDVALTNVHVDVDNGVGSLAASSSGFSGDDGDSILEPGETWQWIVDVFVTGNTTYVATGHGTDPLGTDVTFPGDQDERDSVGVQAVTPSTIVDISSSLATVVAGGTTTLTVTESNDSSLPLTNVHVDVDNGVGSKVAPPTSGDDGDAVLEPGETWVWTIPNVVVSTTTVFTATGFGTDPAGNVITFPGDQDERDSVTVSVVNPSTAVTIDADPTTVTVGGTTTLTVRETNDGTGNLTDVHVDVTPGIGSLNSASSGFSGDDGDNILEPGETWQWIVSGVVVSTTTNYVATGFGTDQAGNIVTFPGDQQERDSVEVQAVTPSTIVDISSSLASVTAGGTTTLTVSEMNDGTVPLTNVHVDIDQGIGSKVAPPTSGDDGDAVLEPGETWVWVIPNVVVSTTTTYTATGFGTDPAGNVITYPGDAQERDAVTVTAIQIAFDGCTLGYWKNHLGSWQVYSPTDTLESVFDVPDSLGMDNVTLLEALNFGGGSGDVGAARILLKQAVASLLNASHSLVDFPLTTQQVIDQTNAALAGGRAAMVSAGGSFGSQNELGCSINAHGEAI